MYCGFMNYITSTDIYSNKCEQFLCTVTYMYHFNCDLILSVWLYDAMGNQIVIHWMKIKEKYSTTAVI